MNGKEHIRQTVEGKALSREEIISLLELDDPEDIKFLGTLARDVKNEHVGNITYLRGLIEFSNSCIKDCLYCGIRRSNKQARRFLMSREEIVDAAVFAWKNGYGSVVLQSGERSNRKFTDFICDVLKAIMDACDGELGITLSCGEQSPETYRSFFGAGASRYLLRIETSSRALYSRLHPNDGLHVFDDRLRCLGWLKETGFQLGSGVMVGLPWQTVGDLADDLIFLRDTDVDMVGLGPYIEHSKTPLYAFRDELWPKENRLQMTLKMIAVLRIMMKDINIASATALQAIDGFGRERALRYGANVIMPTLTPSRLRKDYLLYEDKPCIEEERDECRDCLAIRIRMAGDGIGYGQRGDSGHFQKRNV